MKALIIFSKLIFSVLLIVGIAGSTWAQAGIQEYKVAKSRELGRSTSSGVQDNSRGFPLELMALYSVNAQSLSVNPKQYNIGACPENPKLFFVHLRFPIESHQNIKTLRFALQFPNEKSQMRFVQELNDNYPTRGFPPCFLKEEIFVVGWNPGGEELTYQPPFRDIGQTCQGNPMFQTITQCADAETLYPPSED